MSTDQAFKDLWQEALDKYIDRTGRTEPEQTLLQQSSPGDLEKQLEKERDKFGSFRGRYGKLTGRLKSVIRPFTMLSDVASSALSLSPFAPASTIFAAAVFVVKAANGVSEVYDWIEQLFSKLTDFTSRLEEYCTSGMKSSHRTKVVQILECLLEILAQSEQTIKIGRWRKYAAVLFLGQDEKIKASFDTLAKLFEDEHQLINAITYATNQRMEKKIEEIDKTGKRMLDNVEQARRIEVLDFISTANFPAQQADILDRRQEGTGQLFLQEPKFKSWIHGSKGTLFCPGIPGAGKTMVAAMTIDNLSKMSDNNSVAYVFCNYKSQYEQDLLFLLSAILRQLVQARPSLPVPVLDLHEHHSSRRTKPTPTDIYNALRAVAIDCSSVYIVVDALDECRNADRTRNNFIAKLRDLQQEVGAKLRLMVTSRYVPDISEQFKDATELEIRAADVDVQRYIAAQISWLPRIIQQDIELQSLVQTQITQAANGMFLLARLYVQAFATKRTKRSVLSQLEKISKAGVDTQELYNEAYGEAMERIRDLPPDDCAIARTTISWITYSERPLTTLELCHALAVQPGDLELDKDNILYIEDILSACAGLVVVDKESHIVRLVHYTTQQYFEGLLRTWSPTAQQEITSICLTYLSFESFRCGICLSKEALQSRAKDYVFLDYVSQFWSTHARTVQEQVSKLALAFLQDYNLVRCAIQAVYMARYQHLNLWTKMTGLHLVANLGLSVLARNLLSDPSFRTYVDAKDECGRTPLSIAAEEGCEEVVTMLLERKDVEADSKDEGEFTPLWYAAREGHESIVRLLLDRGDVHPDWEVTRVALEVVGQGFDVIVDRTTPLLEAARNGHESVVKMLLERDDVDINARGEDCGTALWLAASGGHESVVELLIARSDIKVGLTGIHDRTPLSEAASAGHAGIVKLLIARDDVKANTGDFNGQTPLSLAAQGGHDAIVELLLCRDDVRVNAKDSDCRTPLTLAAKEGHESIVKLLVSRNDVQSDMKDDKDRTPLWYAAAEGHEAVVEFMVRRDDVMADSKDNNGQTPLSVAAKGGYESVVKLLIDREDVDASSMDDNGRTPLLWAAMKGNESIVSLLIRREDVHADTRDRNRRTPLSWAAEQGHERVVDLLISCDDVDCNSKDNECRTPLFYAAAGGHDAIVELLLKRNGVMADSKDENGQTPLSAAAEGGHESIVKTLASQVDVEVDSEDCNGFTPLLRAMENGHRAIVELLVARDDVDPNVESPNNHTALSWAAARGYDNVVRILIGRDGVALDSKDRYGRTPLWYAVSGDNETVVKLLIDRDDVEADSKDNGGRTPLMEAAWRGHTSMVKLLFDRDDVQADSPNNNGRTPLWYAAWGGREAVATLLIQRDDVEANSRDRDGRTPLSKAAEGGHESIVLLLANHHKDVHVGLKDAYGRTPLWYAVLKGHEAVVQILLERDDIESYCTGGDLQALLDLAEHSGHDPLVKLLTSKLLQSS